jgi:hypothetical protein
MDPQTNFDEQILKQLQESNHRMKGINNILIGILIATGITALIFIILYSKVSGIGGGREFGAIGFPF